MERGQYEDQDLGGWIILRWYGVDWIGLAQDRDKCRALVNTVISLWVS
jgi:hypothetical protein